MYGHLPAQQLFFHEIDAINENHTMGTRLIPTVQYTAAVYDTNIV